MIRNSLLSIIGLLILTYLYLAFIGVEPKDRRPGTLISGEETALPADLSFVDEVNEITLETRPWYGIPFSVTAVIAAHDGHLYVPSLYDSPQAFPGTKYWNKVVAKDPNVRLRVGDAIYRMTIAPVSDEQEFQAVFAAFGEKFPFWKEQISNDGRAPRFALLRLTAVE